MSSSEQVAANPARAGEETVRRLQLPLPKPFDGSPENWQKWRQRFERYRVSTALEPGKLVSTFLYSMGDIADDILATFTGIDEATVAYSDLLAAFDSHFGARKNTIFARVKFNKRTQKTGETIDCFIQDLHKLAEDCEYGTLKDELIRDRIVVGVTDDDLSDLLQTKAKLTLGEAVQLSRQAEARREGQELLRGREVDFVKSYRPPTGPRTKPQQQNRFSSQQNRPISSPQNRSTPSQRSPNQNVQSRCQYCGHEQHRRDLCPARFAVCAACSKKGHYKIVCRSRPNPVHELTETTDNYTEEEDEYDLFLGCVNSVSDTDCWSAEIQINGKPATFKLDTGASVTVVGKHMAQQQQLTPTQKALKGPGNTPLTVLGSFTAQLRHKNEVIQETVFVLEDQDCNLLSRSACVKLGLIARIGNVSQSDRPDFGKEFPSLFHGLGTLKTEYKIKLASDATPVHLYTARKIAHPLLPKAKEEIGKMLEQKVISPIKEPTTWCSGIVVVPKPNGSVRICVDLTGLNKAVKREIHPMASVDESLAKLGGSKIFTKLDAKSGFWQILLCPESRRLTTFITPFGRFCFNRLPFGISSAPEIFQRAMTEILQDLDGVICHMDDILVHAPEEITHDKRVRAVLQRLQEAGITLNEKCEFSQKSVKFLGHVIDANGIHADPAKTTAIKDFPAPTTVTELQRFMGMVNQLAKFTPNLAEANAPLRELLRKDTTWIWSQDQQQAFQRIKEMLMSPQVLAHYDPKRPTVIAADASNAGIGAVLLQIQEDGSRRPVCFISRSLNDAEKNYAVIEKEALAATWACEKLSEYVLGLDFTLETDHKPLVPLLSTTELYKMPPRIQRFRLRLMMYNPKVTHVQGKQQITADALSRAPVGEPTPADINLLDEVTAFAKQAVEITPASTARLTEIRKAQQEDEVTAQVRKYCTEGWPGYMPENTLLKQYYSNKAHFSIIEDLLMYDERIVIPSSLRLEMLNRLHEGHLGITKCRAMARTCVWWPNISSQIEEMVNKCHACSKLRPDIKEPLLPSAVPDRPWSRLGMDLFELHGKKYIIAVDYLSRWAEIRQLQKETAAATIAATKSIFATHGIPEMVVSDNGPQFSSAEFQAFAIEYQFTHTTSSPRYPQSNGEAERAIQTVKNLLKKAQDPHLALLMYRATPLANGLSPSEILMGRRLRTKLPVLPSTLNPQSPDLSALKQKEQENKKKQQDNYNARHAVQERPPLNPGDSVFIKDLQRQGQVIRSHNNPRSYIVKTEKDTVRRNNIHLVPTPGLAPPTAHRRQTLQSSPSPLPPSAAPPPPPPQREVPDIQVPQSVSSPQPHYTTRSGRTVKQPAKLNL